MDDLYDLGTITDTVNPYASFLPGDAADAYKMQPFVPQASGNQPAPWWESTLKYGITRAIDNRYGPPAVQGHISPGSFAGQNGQTYYQVGNNAARTGYAPGVRPATDRMFDSGTLLLLAAGVGAFLLLRK